MRRWTPEEEAIIRQFYPLGGQVAQRKLMGCRSLASIRQKAQKMGVTVDPDVFRAQRAAAAEIARAVKVCKPRGAGAKPKAKPAAEQTPRPRIQHGRVRSIFDMGSAL